MNIHPRTLICSLAKYEELFEKYSKTRRISCDRNCPLDRFYYWNRRGIMRIVKLPEYSIWETIKDEGGWPTGFIKPLRIRNWLRGTDSNSHPSS